MNMATTPAFKTNGQVINEMPIGKFFTLEKITPIGALQARKQASGGVSLYWRYSIGNVSERVLIGVYDSSAPPKSLQPTKRGYSIAAAVNAAQMLALEHHSNRAIGGRPAMVKATAAAANQAAATKAEASKQTLQRLLSQYCDHLEKLERTSHKDARSIFALHVTEPWPKIAALPANQVTGEQVADMMRRVLELGKGRTANKLRSYIRAAYQTARASRSKASIPVEFKLFNVVNNPAADTEPDESQNKADKHPLSLPELRVYWKAIKDMPDFKGAILRLHLLTGGQRIEQLVKLQTADITADAITLHDGKGRPGKSARRHTLPLIPQASAALKGCKPLGINAISSDGGTTHLAATTLSRWAVEAAADIPDFQAKRIRSGVETTLAAAKISTEIRGRLQSHGISGVQARHYDGHDYLDEKRNALKMLFKLLETPEKSNVVPIRAA
jgi:integrase